VAHYEPPRVAIDSALLHAAGRGRRRISLGFWIGTCADSAWFSLKTSENVLVGGAVKQRILRHFRSRSR
jgi:hypothetical protein